MAYFWGHPVGAISIIECSILTGFGELEAVGDVDNLLVFVEFELVRGCVVVALHFVAKRRVTVR